MKILLLFFESPCLYFTFKYKVYMIKFQVVHLNIFKELLGFGIPVYLQKSYFTFDLITSKTHQKVKPSLFF